LVVRKECSQYHAVEGTYELAGAAADTFRNVVIRIPLISRVISDFGYAVEKLSIELRMAWYIKEISVAKRVCAPGG
jgi:hypothetical protein